MKNILKLSALLMAMLVLFTGCGKQQTDPPTEPAGPPVTEAPTQAPAEAPSAIAGIADPADDLPEEVERSIEEHRYWRETICYFVEEDQQLIDAQLVEKNEAGAEVYAVWLSEIVHPGTRKVSRQLITLTPDGKDHSVSKQEDPAFDVFCQAIQNYRIAEHDMAWWDIQLLTGLGFEHKEDLPEQQTAIPYSDFYAAMMRMVTPELFRQRFEKAYQEKDGKVFYTVGGGNDVPYVVDSVTLQPDGNYLVKLHGFYAPGNRWESTGLAALQTMPDGSYTVAAWADDTETYGVDILTMPEGGSYTVTPWNEDH